MLEQRVKVVSGDWDAGEDGSTWQVHYVLYEVEDDEDRKCWDLYEDDGAGNGTMICRGYSERRMRSLTLRLGTFVQWSAD